MGKLAVFLAGLLGGLVDFFAKWITKKTAWGVASVATFAALTVGMYATAVALLNSVLMAFPGLPGAATGLWVAVPDNVPACITAMLSTDVAIALYRWNVQNLKLMNQA